MRDFCYVKRICYTLDCQSEGDESVKYKYLIVYSFTGKDGHCGYSNTTMTTDCPEINTDLYNITIETHPEGYAEFVILNIIPLGAVKGNATEEVKA